MIKNINLIIGLFLIAFLSSGCVKDGLDECPSGRVNLHLYVEKFRNSSVDLVSNSEENFTDKVNHLRYYLYKDGELINQELIQNFSKATNPCQTFEFTDLDYGDYNLVFIANCTKDALSGDSTIADNLVLTFPSCADTEDFFTAVHPFKVTSNDDTEYEVGLLRTHGIVRYTFNNMPDNISEIEVIVKNVNSEKWVTGTYKETCEASHKYTITPLGRAETDNSYIIGTFPTPEGEYSTYHLNLYRNNEASPYLERMITDTMSVVRNQLLDIAVTFESETDLSFEIELNKDWDGSSSGGETGLE